MIFTPFHWVAGNWWNAKKDFSFLLLDKTFAIGQKSSYGECFSILYQLLIALPPLRFTRRSQ